MSQRTRTRDLLYDFFPPNPIPGSAPLPPHHGKEGDELAEEDRGTLFFNNINDFPIVGKYNYLYFNRYNNTLYCWDSNEGYVPVAGTISNDLENILSGGDAYGQFNLQ